MNTLLTNIVETLSSFLLGRCNVRFQLEDVAFTVADQIVFDGKYVVRRCYSFWALDAEFSAMVSKGPDWIHANFVESPNSKNLILISFGADVGNPSPTINLSHECLEVEYLSPCQ